MWWNSNRAAIVALTFILALVGSVIVGAALLIYDFRNAEQQGEAERCGITSVIGPHEVTSTGVKRLRTESVKYACRNRDGELHYEAVPTKIVPPVNPGEYVRCIEYRTPVLNLSYQHCELEAMLKSKEKHHD